VTTKGKTVHVTVLVDNTARNRGLLGEHGLGFWIETGSKRILFDTGQGMVLEHNAQQLAIPLESADAIVISHGHYDHTGGLAAMLKLAPQATVYAHPAAFEPKYACSSDGTSYGAGTPGTTVGKLRRRSGRLVESVNAKEVFDGLFVTGEIPRVTDFEDTGGRFFLDEKCQHPDPLIDDQAMFFGTPAGTVVLLGCAHAGVINTLQYIRQLTDSRPIHAVTGGMHLVNASPERIGRTVEAIRELGLTCLGPTHCTGTAGMLRLRYEFPDRYRAFSVGTTMEFERAK